MKMRRILSFFLVMVALGLAWAQNLSREEAVDYLVTNYPEAQLCDLYKSFYQDSFGPGHILGDTAASRKYFESELSDTTRWSGPVWEYTGAGKNFIRLNMDLVREGVIPGEVFFQAFVNSLGRVEKPDAVVWVSEWEKVDSIVKSRGYTFNNENKDRDLIKDKLENNNFTMHHSPAYDSIYEFHYRIISLPQFERLKNSYNLNN